MAAPVVVIDNGGHTIKAGIVPAHSEPRVISNAIVRSKGDKTTYVGHEIDRCRDYSSLHFRLPFEKGFLVDWDAQEAVWLGIFSDEVLGISPTECSLLITEPYFNLPNIQDVYDQFVFEEHEFQAYHRCTPASHMSHSKMFKQPGVPTPECMVIVDCGFSFTHVIPILNGNIIWSAVKRLDIGGKLLTNQLKELVSFRQWNMMDETVIMNQVKESCCYVSNDFGRDLELCRTNIKRNPIIQEYILPDLAINRKGRIREGPDEILPDSAQVLIMGSERFSVPEILFRPSDIGLDQAGLADTIAFSISQLPDALQGMFWANIGLIGGSTKFAGFAERLHSELRSIAPVDNEVVLYSSDDPILESYHSLASFASSPMQFSKQAITRQEYLESGHNAVRRKLKGDWQVKQKPIDVDSLGLEVGVGDEDAGVVVMRSAGGTKLRIRTQPQERQEKGKMVAAVEGEGRKVGRTKSRGSLSAIGGSTSSKPTARKR